MTPSDRQDAPTPRTDALVAQAVEAGTCWPLSSARFRDLAYELEYELERELAHVAAQTATLEREVAELKTAIETIRAAWAADDGTAATELAIEDAVCAAMDLAALTRATPSTP